MAGLGEAERIRSDIAHRPMRRLQVVTVGASVLTNILDGFDILALSFLAPTLAREWGLGPERIGFLLSSGLVGMVFGALVLSSLADIIGRRNSVILCLTLMGAGMILGSLAASLPALALCRVATGMGVGGMNAAAGSLAMEYASIRRREQAIGAVVIGYPTGAILGGLLSVWLLDHFGWRAVLLAGGIGSVALIPLFLAFVPESLDFLLARQPRGALTRANRTLSRLGIEPMAALPPRSDVAGDTLRRLLAVFRLPLRAWTARAAALYFLFMMSHYFMLSWAPKLMSQAGATDAGGISISIVINVGGIVGGATIGLVSARYGLRNAAAGAIVLMAALITAFGTLGSNLAVTVPICFALGVALFAATTCVFSVAASGFPPAVRGMGIGMVTSAGRCGSVCGVYVAGLLLTQGLSRFALCAMLSLPALGAAIIISRLAMRARDPGPAVLLPG